jgi:MFS family permease
VEGINRISASAPSTSSTRRAASRWVAAALGLGPQRPRGDADPPPVLRAIGEGLRFVRHNRALAGSFAIGLTATTFGWPTTLFPVLALTVYHAGATGTGLLFTALSTGALLAILSAGWLAHARRLGRVVIGAVLCWGTAIAAAGLVRSLGPALVLFAAAGYADGVSSVCRSTINQTVTPDALRGRMSSLYTLVINTGPRLGNIESGLVAGASSATIALISGGLACITGVAVIARLFPGLAAYRHCHRESADTSMDDRR